MYVCIMYICCIKSIEHSWGVEGGILNICKYTLFSLDCSVVWTEEDVLQQHSHLQMLPPTLKITIGLMSNQSTSQPNWNTKWWKQTLNVGLSVHEPHASQLIQLRCKSFLWRLTGISWSHLSNHLHTKLSDLTNQSIREYIFQNTPTPGGGGGGIIFW